VIRHAVSIDERRAKFRSDLVSEEGRLKKQTDAARTAHELEKRARHERHRNWFQESQRYKPKKQSTPRRESLAVPGDSNNEKRDSDTEEMDNFDDIRPRAKGAEARYRNGSVISQSQGRRGSRYRPHSRSRSRSRSSVGTSVQEREISPSNCSCDTSDSDESVQDIDEIWFPGGHADIGGGWALDEDEVALSHVPLVWIIREARKSGCQFDEEKMASLGCLDDCENYITPLENIPTIQVTESPTAEKNINGVIASLSTGEGGFKSRIIKGATEGKIHDCLTFGKGLPHSSVLAWKIMEFLPFRRLDLTDDGSWKPIRW
jgi:hypothetical protein